MTENTVKEMLVEAAELGDRFPDLGNADVMEHIDLIFTQKVDENSILGRALIMAYEQDIQAAERFIHA